MRTVIASHEVLPRGLKLESLSIETGRVSISVGSDSTRSPCPVCGHRSARAHSRYRRTVSDLPWHGISVTLKIQARRFFCDEPSCKRKIFCERLPEISPRARKTSRLEEALLAIALELGGRAGARLAEELGIAAARDTLLRRIKAAPLPEVGKVRVLGVDDFAFKKGSTYGTILVNLECHEVVDLLPERSQESLLAWFEDHPGAAEAEVATRDRSNIYREELAKGAPGAAHVADRWHLLHNLTLALEEYLLQKRPVLQKAAAPEVAPEEKDDADEFASGPVMPNRPRNHDRKIEEAARKRHERLVEQWKNIRRLYLAGADLRDICRQLGISARTVYRYKDLTEPPPRPAYERKASVLDPYGSLSRRALERGMPQWKTALPRDPRAGLLKQRGDLRPLHRPASSRRGQGKADLIRTPSKAGFRSGTLSYGEERGRSVHAPRREAGRRAGRVSRPALRGGRVPRGHATTDPGVRLYGQKTRRRRLGRVAKGRREVPFHRDAEFRRRLEERSRRGAAGLTEKWSNGCVEGFVHKLKLLKRQGYGRAGFELLRARMLAA
jgi:transposase